MKILRNERGLNLLEVLISMLVLAVGILGLAPMVVMSIEGNNISRDVMTVSSLAKQKMEYFQSLPSMPTMPYSETETGLSGGYDRYTLVQDASVDSTLPADIYRVDVTISWTDNANVQRSTTYSTFLEEE